MAFRRRFKRRFTFRRRRRGSAGRRRKFYGRRIGYRF
jgi:hypothetical protein